MKLPELAVKRPVFTTVLALLLAAFGAMAFSQLATREYPDVSPAQVSIRTAYTGASADVVESRITQPLEEQISGIEGIRSMRSSSGDGLSSINIEFDLGRDIDAATNDVRDKVSRAARRLPDEADKPTVSKADSESSPLVYISIEASDMPVMELTDYAQRHIVDRFAVIPGVAAVNVYGGGGRSMRIWLDRQRLAARGLAVADVVAALRRENLELPAGLLESHELEFPIRVQRGYQTAQQFRSMVVSRGEDGHLIRIGELARVEEGSATSRRLFITNGRESMSVGIVKQSSANTVDVLAAVREEIEAIENDLPDGMGLSTSGDASAFIRAAISGVYTAMLITISLVSLVILMFLGTLRATLIPIVCIPLSLLGAVIALQVFGYSINLITLLAMVLAIGLVVDDAIVVLENIYRRIESGEPPLLAASRGASQVGFAVIATTAVLLAVFSPVIFIEDKMGKIFSELAVAICVAVVVSSVMALTLVPMLCSKLLRRDSGQSVLAKGMDGLVGRCTAGYAKSLRFTLARPWLTVLGLVVSVAAIVPLLQRVPTEFVPLEDQDTVMVMAIAQEGTGMDTMRGIINQLQAPLLAKQQRDGSLTRVLFVSPFFGSTAPTRAFSRLSLVPWDQRDFTAFEFKDEIVKQYAGIPGIRVMAFMPSGLGQRGANNPVQFVLQGQDYQQLAEWRDIIMEAARESGLFSMLNGDLRETQQQIHVAIDSDRAASLGVSVKDVGEALQALMTEQEVSTYTDDGEEYPVIVQLERDQRVVPDDIGNIFVRSVGGELIQLSNLLQTENVAGIGTMNRYNRMRAVTISGGMAAGVTLGDALQFLEQTVAEKLPAQARIGYRGESLDYKESSAGLLLSFGLALLVLYLVMAAQFESFVHPTVIMLTVPLALTGGLLGLLLAGQTLNLFSQIGMLMIVGIATKNGILLVEFINQVRDQGVAFEQAIIEACKLRLRPVLMTTISTLVGAIPLVVMTGPGSASRNVLGVVVLSGVSLATIFTLYMIPGFYSLIARRTGSPEVIAREMARLEAEQDPEAATTSD